MAKNIDIFFEKAINEKYSFLMDFYLFKRQEILRSIDEEILEINKIKDSIKGNNYYSSELDLSSEDLQSYSSFLKKTMIARIIFFVFISIFIIAFFSGIFIVDEGDFRKVLLSLSLLLFILSLSIILKFPLVASRKLFYLAKKADKEMSEIKALEKEQKEKRDFILKKMPEIETNQEALMNLKNRILSNHIYKEEGPISFKDYETKTNFALFLSGEEIDRYPERKDVIIEQPEIYKDLSDRMILPKSVKSHLIDTYKMMSKI